MFSVPLYFQVTSRSSNAVAGAHLFPAVVGNAAGGILSGIWIRRYVDLRRIIFHVVIRDRSGEKQLTYESIIQDGPIQDHADVCRLQRHAQLHSSDPPVEWAY